MDSAVGSRSDIMERRLMGGGAGGFGASVDVGRSPPGEEGSSEDKSYSTMYYRRVFAPLSKDPNETTMIDFVQLQSEGDDAELGGPDDQMELDDIDETPNAGRGADIISRIVAKYVVPSKTARNLGYEDDDDFFDDAEQEERQQDKHIETIHGGFFVNAGDIDTKKRKREESGFTDESPVKRRRGDRERERDYDISTSKQLHPDIEDAITEFSEAVKKGGFSDCKRFPKELDEPLAKVARVASSKHQNGWITIDVCNRVAQHIPLQPSTLRMRMKQLAQNFAGPLEGDEDEDGVSMSQATQNTNGFNMGGEDTMPNPAQLDDRIRRLEHYKTLRDEWMKQFRESVDRKLHSIVTIPEVQKQMAALKGIIPEGTTPPGRDKWRWAPEQKLLIAQMYEINSRIVKLHNRVRQELIAAGRTADSQRLGSEMNERNEVSILYKFLVKCFPAGWYTNQSFAQMVTTEKKKHESIPIPIMGASTTPSLASSSMISSPIPQSALGRSTDGFGSPGAPDSPIVIQPLRQNKPQKLKRREENTSEASQVASSSPTPDPNYVESLRTQLSLGPNNPAYGIAYDYIKNNPSFCPEGLDFNALPQPFNSSPQPLL